MAWIVWFFTGKSFAAVFARMASWRGSASKPPGRKGIVYRFGALLFAGALAGGQTSARGRSKVLPGNGKGFPLQLLLLAPPANLGRFHHAGGLVEHLYQVRGAGRERVRYDPARHSTITMTAAYARDPSSHQRGGRRPMRALPERGRPVPLRSVGEGPSQGARLAGFKRANSQRALGDDRETT